MCEPSTSAPIADVGLELPELFCHKRGPDDMEQPTVASPGNASMHSYLAPRKSARLAQRRSPADPLRQIRLNGFLGRSIRLTGHLGRLPLEVRRGAGFGLTNRIAPCVPGCGSGEGSLQGGGVSLRMHPCA